MSTFAAALCLGALTYIGKAVQERLARLGERLGQAEEPDAIDWLGADP